MTDNTDERAGGGPGSERGEIVPRILVFFDYACQFCYLDWPRFKRLRAEHDAELFLVPFELRPAMPAQGEPLPQAAAHSERVEEYMRRMAREADIGLVFPEFVPNTHEALTLGEFARDAAPEVHEQVHEAIFSAYSAGGQDIGAKEVLLDIAHTHGFDVAEVAAAFADARYDDRLHQFRHLAIELGITATPSALICNELLIGTRPYEVLEASIERCLVNELNVEELAQAEPLADEAGDSSATDGSPAAIDR